MENADASNSVNWLDVVDELDQLPPERRADRLAELSLSPEDRQRVAKCLAFGERATGFLNSAPLDSSHLQPTLATNASVSYDVPAAEATPSIDGYTITGRLGEGGMGTVWRATQLSTNREVALKLLTLATFGSHRARQRFEREVELTAKLEHPNIAHVYDSGVRQGAYFYAMELVDGASLDQYVRANKLDTPRILQLMRLVCRAVQHAHQRGIIHRDLKPSNILVTPAGEPKVLDFGLAKALEGDRQQVSLDGDVAGTPAYMSPEQASGQLDKLDTRSDVYTLGVILFHLLTGTFPHDTSGAMIEVKRRVAEEEPRRLRHVSPNADRELDALLAKATAREPARRYGSAGERDGRRRGRRATDGAGRRRDALGDDPAARLRHRSPLARAAPARGAGVAHAPRQAGRSAVAADHRPVVRALRSMGYGGRSAEPRPRAGRGGHANGAGPNRVARRALRSRRGGLPSGD
jgi:hypothetical protein